MQIQEKWILIQVKVWIKGLKFLTNSFLIFLIIWINQLLHKVMSKSIINRFNTCHRPICQSLVRDLRMDLGWKEEAFNIKITSNKFLIIICKLGLIKVYLIAIKIHFRILAMLWVRNGVMVSKMMFSWINNSQLLLEPVIVIIILLNCLFSKVNSLYINIL